MSDSMGKLIECKRVLFLRDFLAIRHYIRSDSFLSSSLAHDISWNVNERYTHNDHQAVALI